MKVLNLQCQFKHDFEGWFGSEEDFRSQLSNEMIECPMCASREITKMLSAPRLNLGASAPREEKTTHAERGESVDAQITADVSSDVLATSSVRAQSNLDIANLDPKQLQQAWLKMVHHVISTTQDVGTQFVSEARKMHYGETQEQGIRGQATPDETRELLEEGIAVIPLPIPAALKGTIQ